MRYINKSKPIRFSLLVGGKECLVVEDVKKNFNLSDLYDSLINQNLAKWLSQIGKTDLLEKIESISKTDMLTQKIGLYNLFAPNKLSSDSPNIGTVKELLVKCCITFDDLKGTQYARNIELKKTAIENVDDEIINRWCESDLELLKYVYSKKSYNVLNERNSRTLIDKKIVTDKNLILNFRNFLEKETGKVWKFDIDYEPLGETLAFLEARALDNDRKNISEYPLVKAILAEFNGAKIETFIRKSVEAAEDDEQTDGFNAGAILNENEEEE